MAILGLSTKKEVETKISDALAVAAADTQKRIDEAVKAAMLSSMPRWLMQTAGAEQYNMPDPSVYENQADLYRKLSWVLSAVEIASQFAATTPFSVARLVSGKEPKDIPNHAFEMLLQKPNPLDSRFEFLFATFALYKLTGNSYWWLNRKDEFAEPTEMWVIPSHMIIPVPDRQMFIRGYHYYPGDGDELLLEPWEIVHFRRFNPFSRFLGLSAIEALAVIALGDLEMQKWNTRNFGDNNGRLPSILTFEEMIEDGTWGTIKEDTREAARKRELMMLRGVGKGVNWLQSSVTQKEMEFLDGRRFNREEIWNVLAPGLFSMLSENATEANSRTGAAAFNRLTIFPMHVTVNEKVTNEILPAYPGRPTIGHFESVIDEDRELKLREIETFAKFHPIDEVREEMYGDEPIGDERGDLLVSQVNAQSGGIQEPAPSPFQNQKPPMDKQAQDQQDPNTEDDTAEEDMQMPKGKAVKANETSAMIALRIPDALRYQLQSKYPFMDNETRDDLHITLVFLGDNRTIDKTRVFSAINAFAVQQAPIKGTLQGLARFVNGGDVDPLVATFDSHQMPEVFSELTEALENNLVPFHRDHGFIPHMTLGYIPSDAPMPIDTIEPLEMNFSEVYYVDGVDWIPVYLTGFANKMDTAAQAVLMELSRWQRKAERVGVKTAAMDTPKGFICEEIPTELSAMIRRDLPFCEDKADIKALFEKAKGTVKAQKPKTETADDAATVLEGIRLALQALPTKETRL